MGEAQISAGRGAEAVGPGEGLRGGRAAGVRALFLASRERGRGCGSAYDDIFPDGRERPMVEDLELCIAVNLRRRAESRWRDGGRVVWGTIVSNLRRGGSADAVPPGEGPWRVCPIAVVFNTPHPGRRTRCGGWAAGGRGCVRERRW